MNIGLSHTKYRADIDGLRAVAVLSVVVFHAFPTALPGGFIGVDIFFVISGFLISTIIFENLSAGRFSFVDFYVRRVKRIFPALILVLVAGLSFGWVGLLADEYKQLGYQSAGAAGFVANLLFWQQSGYFDTSAAAKPLLHLWSLGVEEQFYIVWPVLIGLFWRFRLNSILAVIVIAAGSFWANLHTVDSEKVAAFYSPQTRFWELLVGACLACPTIHRKAAIEMLWSRPSSYVTRWINLAGVPAERSKLCDYWRDVLSIVGVVCVLIGLYWITGESRFPGVAALWPTLGAASLIAAGSQAVLNRIVLSNRAVVWIGLVSYPLYLWHWPLLALSPAFSYSPLAIGKISIDQIRVLAVVASFPLAWATYRYVEMPLRMGGNATLKAMSLATSMLVIGLTGYLIYQSDGLPLRNVEVNRFLAYFENAKPDYRYFERLKIIERYRTDCNFFDVDKDRHGHSTQVPIPELDRSCFTKKNSENKVVFIWGDSHASQLYYGLEQTLAANWEILIVATSGCPVNVDAPQVHKEVLCDKSNSLAISKIAELKPEVVLIGQLHALTAMQMRQVAARLQGIGVEKVVIAGPDPQWEMSLPTIIAKRLQFSTAGDIPNRSFIGLKREVMQENDRLLREIDSDNLIYVDLFKAFCNSSGCLTRIGNRLAEDSVTWDYGHLTPVASDYLARHVLAKVIFEEAGVRK